MKKWTITASAFTLLGTDTSAHEDKTVELILRTLPTYIWFSKGCVIPFELLSTAVREGTADDNIPFHKVENLRSQDMKWLLWSRVRQDFWLLLQYSSFHGGRSTEDRGKGEKDKGLFEERGVGKKQNGRRSCAKPVELCKQRQVSTGMSQIIFFEPHHSLVENR